MSTQSPSIVVAAIGRMITALLSKLTDKQDVLVSGTNIKTVNDQSLLGSGNLSIVGIVDPLTTQGDLLVRGASATTRLAKGADRSMLLAGASDVAYGNNPILAGYNDKFEVMTNGVMDVSLTNIKKKVMTAATTFSFTGITSGVLNTVVLYLEGGNTYAPTFPASVKWIDGAPTLTAKDRFIFETLDDGVTWYGTYLGSYA